MNMYIQSHMFFLIIIVIACYFTKWFVIQQECTQHPVLLTLIIFGMCTYIGPSFHAFVIV